MNRRQAWPPHLLGNDYHLHLFPPQRQCLRRPALELNVAKDSILAHCQPIPSLVYILGLLARIQA